MPELPEAETIARTLHQRLEGRTFSRVQVHRADIVHGDPRPLEETLPGRRVVRVSRRAKQVVFELDPTAKLAVRLGMTGRLMLVRPDAPLQPHTHMQAWFADTAEELRFCDPRRFGGLWLLTPGGALTGRRLTPPGPEPLTLRPAEFRTLLVRKRPIKSLLMDQTIIAGLGNIYCDESLFAAGVHPLTPARRLRPEQADRLLRAIKQVLRRAIAARGSTILDYRDPDGNGGTFRRQHRVYQREGEKCRSCGSVIRRIVLTGRSTFFCPTCQRR